MQLRMPLRRSKVCDCVYGVTDRQTMGQENRHMQIHPARAGSPFSSTLAVR